MIDNIQTVLTNQILLKLLIYYIFGEIKPCKF